jgi:inorganic pyrophosphatase
VLVVVETPRGHRNKYTFDPATGFFKQDGLLPIGSVFPYDFGFLPGTLAANGSPVVVLILMDEAAYPGCLVPSRLIGIIEAEITGPDGATLRGDRLLAVAETSELYAGVQSTDDLRGGTLVEQVQYFLVWYNEVRGRTFTPLGLHGPERARQSLEAALSGSRPRSRRTAQPRHTG